MILYLDINIGKRLLAAVLPKPAERYPGLVGVAYGWAINGVSGVYGTWLALNERGKPVVRVDSNTKTFDQAVKEWTNIADGKTYKTPPDAALKAQIAALVDLENNVYSDTVLNNIARAHRQLARMLAKPEPTDLKAKAKWKADITRAVAALNAALPNAAQAKMEADLTQAVQTACMGKACFASRTPMLTPLGERYIDDIRVGDEVWSCDEWNPHGEVVAKRVEEVFKRFAPIIHVHVLNEVIRTTSEHPFWVVNRCEWVAAGGLQPGDVLIGVDGQTVRVTEVFDTGEWEVVYNLRVADYHTYFVSGDGWSVWAHNVCLTPMQQAALEAILTRLVPATVTIGGHGTVPGPGGTIPAKQAIINAIVGIAQGQLSPLLEVDGSKLLNAFQTSTISLNVDRLADFGSAAEIQQSVRYLLQIGSGEIQFPAGNPPGIEGYYVSGASRIPVSVKALHQLHLSSRVLVDLANKLRDVNRNSPPGTVFYFEPYQLTMATMQGYLSESDPLKFPAKGIMYGDPGTTISSVLMICSDGYLQATISPGSAPTFKSLGMPSYT